MLYKLYPILFVNEKMVPLYTQRIITIYVPVTNNEITFLPVKNETYFTFVNTS